MLALAAEPLPLPTREVAILDRQLGEGRGAAGRVRGVERRHLEDQDAGGPAVRHDVVDREQGGVVGLFAPQERRTLSAVCEEECRLSTIAREKVLELYYQDPRFGYFLIRLVASLLIDNGARPASAAAG